jgi:hypothetical protein
VPSGRLALSIVALGAAAACAPATGTLAQPGPPAVWILVTSDAGDLRIALPPWLVPFDTTGAIFANEIVAGGGQGVEIMAEGPGVAEQQPGREGAEGWLRRRVEAPGAGHAEIVAMRLPAGDAVSLRRIEREGTPLVWRLAAYAISRPRGTAYLLVDGPPDAWTGREEDIERILELVIIRP